MTIRGNLFMRKFKTKLVLHFLHTAHISKVSTSFFDNIVWDILTREYNTLSVRVVANNSFTHTENTLEEFRWMYYYEKF